MDPECLPFSRIPHTTPLFSAFLHDFERVRPFFAYPPHQTTWFAERAGAINFDPERRARVADILAIQNRAFGASAKALANIERLRAGACAAVTGHQVGLFGGPLFSLLKALTAVRMAEAACHGGIDCVPVFWLATEDHDLAEVDEVMIPGSDGVLHRLDVKVESASDAPVGDIRFGPEIEGVVAQAADLLGEADIVSTLRESYRPGAGFGEAFGRAFARVFADFGVVMLDARDPELHRLAAPLYLEAVRQAGDLDAALLRRGEALRHTGFHEQVKVTSSSTLLFAVHNGSRTVIHRNQGNFSFGSERIEESELLARIAAAPEQFSPNVLLRPVVQDFLLPTFAYVGGPAEVAYFAQSGVVYEKLLGRVTPIWPRISATLVEPHAKRLLERYGLNITDLFQDPEHLRALLAKRSLPPDLQQSFDVAHAALESSLTTLTASLDRLDHTLVDAAKNAGAKMRYQLERLRTRAASAETRRNEVISRHAAQLSGAIYPEQTLAERIVAAVHFLARYPDLLPSLYATASFTCPDHQVIYL